jgi:Ser-Thr-rich glycosyl-phosphatidyl-inositol-anchored membrane family
MKKINFLSVALIVVFALSCSKELEKPQEQQKLKIELGTVAQNLGGGRTDANIITPGTGTFNAGNTMNISWSFILDGSDWTSSLVNIELLKNPTSIQSVARIARDIPFFDAANSGGNQYNWTIPSMASTGNDFFIRITNAANNTQFADSQLFSLVTPSTGCFFSRWSLMPAPIYSTVLNNSTLQWQIKEDALAQSVLANNPSLWVNANAPTNVTYNGITYYCSGTVIIPINGTTGCSGIDPIINAPLTFQKIGTGFVFIQVALQSVSTGHYTSGSGYQSFYLN